MKKKILHLCLILCILSSLMGCGKKKLSEEEKLNQEAKATFVAEIGSTPNTEKSDNGGDQYIYENSVYCGYTGTATYYFTSGVVVFTRWETKDLDQSTALKMYKDICKQEQERTSSKAQKQTQGKEKSATITTDDGTITIQMVEESEKYSLLVNQTGSYIMDIKK